MINSFADKDLESCWRANRCGQIPESLRAPLFMNLTILDAVTGLEDLLHIPGCQVQPLPGKQKGVYSLIVLGPWHLIFRYDNGMFSEIWLKQHQYGV